MEVKANFNQNNHNVLSEKNISNKQPVRLVNWFIQSQEISLTRKDKLVHQNPRKVHWSKQSLKKLFPSRIISLQINQQQEKENLEQDFSHQSNTSTGGARSQKNSLEKKDKLKVMSKRLSVRKINDFMNCSLNQTNQEYLNYCPQENNTQERKQQKQEIPKEENKSVSKEKMQKDEVSKKKKIRISLRREKADKE